MDELNDDLLRNGYFCVYRKRKEDSFFRFFESVSINERTTTDRDIPAGESAEYKVRLRTTDGRLSRMSPAVKILHPAAE